jgi:hypothetical protein
MFDCLIWAEGQAVELVYRSFRVRATPELNADTDCWIPKAEVFWEEEGSQRHQLLTGWSDVFKVIDEAEIYAVEMAKAWINAELVTAPLRQKEGSSDLDKDNTHHAIAGFASNLL